MTGKKDEVIIHRRRLPHWRMVGATYFVTWRLHEKQSELTPDERETVASALKHFDGDRYDLFAYVVMPDHVHVLVRPLDKYPLQDLVHSWKSYTAYRLQRDFKKFDRIWQDEYMDRIIRDDKELYEKAQYILNNPLKRWPDLTKYPWAWFKSGI